MPTTLDAGVQVVAHENLEKNLAADTVEPKPASPSLTYAGGLDTLTLGSVKVELHHFGRARDLVHMGVPQDQLLSRIKTDDIGWALRVPLERSRRRGIFAHNRAPGVP
jgi:hypothetical protein